MATQQIRLDSIQWIQSYFFIFNFSFYHYFGYIKAQCVEYQHYTQVLGGKMSKQYNTNLTLTVSVYTMLVDTLSKNIAQVFILERYFFVSIYPAASHGTCLAVFLAAVLPLC